MKKGCSVTFHKLFRGRKSDDGELTETTISDSDFADLKNKLKSLPRLDLEDEDILERLRRKLVCDMLSYQEIATDTISGVFQGPYSGQKMENNVVGEIPADSINFIDFVYVIHRANSGNIYLATQYSGQYGAYGPLFLTLKQLIQNHQSIKSKAIISSSHELQGARISKIEVGLSKKGRSSSKPNSFTNTSAIVMKADGKIDDFTASFSKEVIAGDDVPERQKKRLAEAISSSGQYEIDVEDIENCKVLATINNNKIYINLFQNGVRATAFKMHNSHIGEEICLDKARTEIVEILESEIISVHENV